jgi:hypothetical protein
MEIFFRLTNFPWNKMKVVRNIVVSFVLWLLVAPQLLFGALPGKWYLIGRALIPSENDSAIIHGRPEGGYAVGWEAFSTRSVVINDNARE